MIPDLDIYRSANVLIRKHGKDARLQAAMRADAGQFGCLRTCTGGRKISASGYKRTLWGCAPESPLYARKQTLGS